MANSWDDVLLKGITLSRFSTVIKRKLSEGYLPLTGGTITGSTTIHGMTTKRVYVENAYGRPSYLLMFDITDWYGSSETNITRRGFVGTVTSSRGWGYIESDHVAEIRMGVSYQYTSAEDGSQLTLRTNNTYYRPCIIFDSVNNKYYLSLRIHGPNRNMCFHGVFTGTYVGTVLESTDSSGTPPTGYEVAISEYKIISVSRATGDKNGNDITTTYLPLSGGTMSGKVILKANAEILPPVGITGTATHANGFIFSNSDNSRFGSMGAYGVGGTYSKFFIGFGSSAYADGNGLDITADTIKWKGKELSVSGHTHSYLPLTGGTLTGRVQLPSRNGSFIDAMTLSLSSIGISTQQTTGYHSLLTVKTYNGNVVNIGGFKDNFGVYGYLSGRTTNETDWRTVWNSSTGDMTTTGNIRCANIKSSNTLTSVSDCEASTESTDIAGAAALAELSTTIGYKYSTDDATSYTVTNPYGVDITSSISATYDVSHTKIGKIHFITVYGGFKIYSSTTSEANYTTKLKILLPDIPSTRGGLITLKTSSTACTISDPQLNIGSDVTHIGINYTQTSTTSQYTPDSVYYITAVMMFIES